MVQFKKLKLVSDSARFQGDCLLVFSTTLAVSSGAQREVGAEDEAVKQSLSQPYDGVVGTCVKLRDTKCAHTHSGGPQRATAELSRVFDCCYFIKR